MKIVTKYGLTIRGNNQSLNIIFRSVRKYEIVVGHTSNPPSKSGGALVIKLPKSGGARASKPHLCLHTWYCNQDEYSMPSQPNTCI